MKDFLITVDTEGDNQWELWKNAECSTENGKYIPRFQELCEEYGFKPVYLLTYEMIGDSTLAQYLKKKLLKGKCEIGTHLHAWNSPPYYALTRKFDGNPYITEYPDEIIYEKLRVLTNRITDVMEERPYSHRAGRWASSDSMFRALDEMGYLVDCSIVSGWDGRCNCGQTIGKGFDYRNYRKESFWITESILEVPMVVNKKYDGKGRNLRQKVCSIVRGRDVWLRPAVSDLESMKEHVQSDSDYSMFMIHSTELMPGGSPYFSTAEDIEHEYGIIEAIFSYVAKNHKRATLSDYYYRHKCDK